MILIAVADPGFPIGRGTDLLGVLTSDAGAFLPPGSANVLGLLHKCCA